MQNKQIKQAKLPFLDRLGVKLGLLFVFSFLTVFIGGFAWDVLASVAESKIAEEKVRNQPAPVIIDPKIEPELAKVLNFDSTPVNAQVKDPFTERNNITGQIAPATAAVTSSGNANPGAANQTPGTVKIASKPAANSTIPNSKDKNNTAAGNQGATAPKAIVSSPEATFERMRLRDQRIRAGGDGGPESTVYAVDDLLPIGVVSGGEGQEEVMFFSQSMNRTMSFPIGARFFDGWLVGKRPEGVEFSGYGQNNLIIKTWERDLKQRTATSYSTTSSPILGTSIED